MGGEGPNNPKVKVSSYSNNKEIGLDENHETQPLCDVYKLEFPKDWKVYFGGVDSTSTDISKNIINTLGIVPVVMEKDGERKEFKLHFLSSKIGDENAHKELYNAMASYLVKRAAEHPFSVADAAYSGTEFDRSASSEHSSFFGKFLFFCSEANIKLLETARQLLPAHVHRILEKEDGIVSIENVSDMDESAMIEMVTAPSALAPWNGEPNSLSRALDDKLPEHVFTGRPEETVDTPENRFVVCFLRQICRDIDEVLNEMQQNVVAVDSERVLKFKRNAENFLTIPEFDQVGAMETIPAGSQYLSVTPGYSELWKLYLQYDGMVKPLKGISDWIRNRTYDKLFEFFFFFLLLEDLSQGAENVPEIKISLPEKSNQVNGQVEASPLYTPENAGILIQEGLPEGLFCGWEDGSDKWMLAYNMETGKEYSLGDEKISLNTYTLAMRPDYVLFKKNGGTFEPVIVLDAKFRRMKKDKERNGSDNEKYTPYRDAIIKLHAYKDSLGCNLAVGLFLPESNEQSFSFKQYKKLTRPEEGIIAIGMDPAKIMRECNFEAKGLLKYLIIKKHNLNNDGTTFLHRSPTELKFALLSEIGAENLREIIIIKDRSAKFFLSEDDLRNIPEDSETLKEVLIAIEYLIDNGMEISTNAFIPMLEKANKQISNSCLEKFFGSPSQWIWTNGGNVFPSENINLVSGEFDNNNPTNIIFQYNKTCTTMYGNNNWIIQKR